MFRQVVKGIVGVFVFGGVIGGNVQAINVRCQQLLAKLVQSEDVRPTERIASHYLKTRFSEVIGSETGEKYRLLWYLMRDQEGEYLHFGFVDASGQSTHVDLRLREQENILELALPRGLEREFVDLSLLRGVLEHIHDRTNLGDLFEIVVNDPTIVEMFNEQVSNVFFKTHRIDEELRRADFDGGSADIAELLRWNADSDVFFPAVSEGKGFAYIKSIQGDIAFERLLKEKFEGTELCKTIRASGDWNLKIELRRNPRFSMGQVFETSKSDAGPVYPMEWRLILEPLK